MMKKYFYLCVFVLVGCLGFFSCKQLTLPDGKKGMSAGGPSSNSTGWSAPTNFTVSHGLYRRIELSWTPVRGAKEYEIWSAQNHTDEFVRETGVFTSASAILDCEAGSGRLYKVRAKNGNTYSSFSLLQFGTTLAAPQITWDGDDGGISWQMNNFRDGSEYASYETEVCYEVYYGKDESNFTLAATFFPDEEGVANTNWKFGNVLDSGTNYFFKVRAYLKENPEEWEESIPMDHETLHRVVASPATNFAVSSGMYPDKIALKFTTPPYVEIKKSDDTWERRSVYFEIRRSLAGLNMFETITPTGGIGVELDGFKVYAEGTKADFNLYNKEQVLTVFDSTALKSGEVYDYEIVSWGDFTTHDNVADTKGEKTEVLSASLLRNISSLNTVTIEKITEGSSGTETVSFQTDWRDISEPVSFTLSMACKIGDAASFDPEVVLSENLTINAEGFLCVEDGTVFTYSQAFDGTVLYVQFNLTGKYIGENPAEFTDLGEISKSTNEILFTTTPAPYLNKIVATDGFVTSSKITMYGVDPITGLGCDFEDDVEYTLFYGVDGDLSNEFADIESSNFTLTGLESGKTYSAKLQAVRNGLKAETPEVAFTTLGAPSINVPYGTHSYDQIKVGWTETPAAEHYLLKYTTADGEEVVSSAINPGDFTGTEPVSYSNISVTRLGDKYTAYITHPDATDHSKSGKPLEVKVQAVAKEATEALSSTNLFGPAEVEVSATKAESHNYVEIAWNHLNGAKAYRIYRNRADEIVDEYVVYLDEKTGNWVVALGGTSLIEDTEICELVIDGNRFVLTDKVVFDNKKEAAKAIAGEMYGSWVENQSQMAWDTAFEYKVIPHYNRSISQVKYVLEDVPTVAGYVLGYPTNVVVSRGYDDEFSVAGDSVAINSVLNSAELNKAVFDKIRITWNPPKPGKYSAVKPSGGYRIYRRKVGDTSWQVICYPDKSDSFYLDETAHAYTMYDYMVVAVAGDGNVSPAKDADYVASLEKVGNNRGYKLGSITMSGVSRNRTFNTDSGSMVLTRDNTVQLTKNGVKTFQELVSWRVLGDDNSQNRVAQPSGFIVEVQNTDIGGDYRVIADLPLTINQQGRSNVAYQAVLSTFGFDGKKSGDSAYNTGLDMLKVLDNYKHTFRVRAYVTDPESGRRSYSAASNTAWGAREITHEEFARAAGQVMGPAIQNGASQTGVGSWLSHSAKWYESTPSNMSGYMYSTSNWTVDIWGFLFNDVKGNFMTIRGKLGALTKKSGKPKTYLTIDVADKASWLDDRPKYGNIPEDKFSEVVAGEDITIIGPSDVNGMYSGDIYFRDVGISSGGTLGITYNGTTELKSDGFAKYMDLPRN